MKGKEIILSSGESDGYEDVHCDSCGHEIGYDWHTDENGNDLCGACWGQIEESTVDSGVSTSDECLGLEAGHDARLIKKG